MELKPCPFCGNKPKVETMHDKFGFVAFIQCINPITCGVSMAHVMNKESDAVEVAAKAWNARPHSDAGKVGEATALMSQWIYKCSEKAPPGLVARTLKYMGTSRPTGDEGKGGEKRGCHNCNRGMLGSGYRECCQSWPLCSVIYDKWEPKFTPSPTAEKESKE